MLLKHRLRMPRLNRELSLWVFSNGNPRRSTKASAKDSVLLLISDWFDELSATLGDAPSVGFSLLVSLSLALSLSFLSVASVECVSRTSGIHALESLSKLETMCGSCIKDGIKALFFGQESSSQSCLMKVHYWMRLTVSTLQLYRTQ